MKRNYILCLLGILNIGYMVFAMQSDEQKAQEMLQKAQDFLSQEKYKDAYYLLFQLNGLKKNESDHFAEASKELEQSIAQVIQNAQKELIDHSNPGPAYALLLEFKDASDKPGSFGENIKKQLMPLLVNHVSNELKTAVNAHQYDNAKDSLSFFMSKLKMSYGLLYRDPYAQALRDLEKALAKAILDDMQPLINYNTLIKQRGYTNIYEKLSDLKKLSVSSLEKDVFAQVTEDLEEMIAQEGLKFAQQLASQKKYKEAGDILININALMERTQQSDPSVVQAIGEVAKVIAENDLKDAQQSISQGKHKEGYIILARAKKFGIPQSDPLIKKIEEVGKSIAQDDLEAARQFINQGKYKEAYNILTTFREATTSYAARELEQMLTQVVKNAQQLVDQNKPEKAHEILIKFKALNIDMNIYRLLFAEVEKLEQLLTSPKTLLSALHNLNNKLGQVENKLWQL